MSEGQHLKTAKVASTVNLILLAITITVVLLVTPLNITVTRIDNKEMPMLRDRQLALELAVKETEIRYHNIERLLERLTEEFVYIRGKLDK